MNGNLIISHATVADISKCNAEKAKSFGSVGGFNRIRRNHHYVLKQVNPNL